MVGINNITEVIDRISSAHRREGIVHVFWRGFEYLVLQSHPTAKLYWKIIPYWYNEHYGAALSSYEHFPVPFTLYEISPGKIRRCTSRGKVRDGVLTDVGKIKSGNWDQKPPSWDEHNLFYAYMLEDTLIYKAMKNRYQHEQAWEDTEFYGNAVKIIESGGSVWHGCTTKLELNQRCKEVDNLFSSISDEGYRKQTQLRNNKPNITDPFGYFNEYVMEVSVDISRNGDLLLVDGRHRLIISQLLGLEKIPVAIIVRHSKWIEYCERNEVHEASVLQ